MKIATATLTLLMAMLCTGLLAQKQKPKAVEQVNDPAKHHQDLTLRITADQPAAFTLPTSDSPIRLDLSAWAIGYTGSTQPDPILRSATLLHRSIVDAVFLADGSSPAVALTSSGVSFANQPGAGGVGMTIGIAHSPGGVPRQIIVSAPEPMSGGGQQFFNQIEVRISLWY